LIEPGFEKPKSVHFYFLAQFGFLLNFFICQPWSRYASMRGSGGLAN